MNSRNRIVADSLTNGLVYWFSDCLVIYWLTGTVTVQTVPNQFGTSLPFYWLLFTDWLTDSCKQKAVKTAPNKHCFLEGQMCYFTPTPKDEHK